MNIQALLHLIDPHQVSAVSRLSNTTRGQVMGVLTEGPVQLVFSDTPGVVQASR